MRIKRYLKLNWILSFILVISQCLYVSLRPAQACDRGEGNECGCTVTITSAPGTLCAAESYTLTATATGSDCGVIQWSETHDTGVSISGVGGYLGSPQTINVSSTTGSGIVTVKASTSCGSSSHPIYISGMKRGLFSRGTLSHSGVLLSGSVVQNTPSGFFSGDEYCNGGTQQTGSSTLRINYTPATPDGDQCKANIRIKNDFSGSTVVSVQTNVTILMLGTIARAQIAAGMGANDANLTTPISAFTGAQEGFDGITITLTGSYSGSSGGSVGISVPITLGAATPSDIAPFCQWS